MVENLHVDSQQAGTWVIVPTFNEAQVVRHTILSLLRAGYQLIVVDDGSTDQTPSLLKDLPIHYLRHKLNLGQGAALGTGMRFARRLNAAYVVHFDADGQHPVDQINDLLQPLIQGEADIVLGSRFLNQQSAQHIPLVRRLVLMGGRCLNGLMTGLWMSDAHNGFRAMNGKALSAIHLHQPRMAHATEILQEIKRHQLRWKEVPVNISYSSYSLSKGNTLWDGFGILAELFFK